MKIAIVSIMFFLMNLNAKAEVSFLPENRISDSTASSVLFEDPYFGFLFRTQGRVIGTLAFAIPLAAWSEDTIFLQTGVEVSLRMEGITFYSESLDLRVGFNWVHPLSKNLFLSLGASHTSGHVMDDVHEKELIPLNVGVDGFPVRLVYDSENLWRAGLHLTLAPSSDPPTRGVFGGVFGELYPFSGKTNQGLYLGTDLSLPEKSSIALSTITQVGYAYRRAKAVFGFHSGEDTRLKHQLYLGSTSNFWFTGIKFEI